ncbi:hypothetical protein pb186bvf_013674 [Paramecium bursaria]
MQTIQPNVFINMIKSKHICSDPTSIVSTIQKKVLGQIQIIEIIYQKYVSWILTNFNITYQLQYIHMLMSLSSYLLLFYSFFHFFFSLYSFQEKYKYSYYIRIYEIIYIICKIYFEIMINNYRLQINIKYPYKCTLNQSYQTEKAEKKYNYSQFFFLEYNWMLFIKYGTILRLKSQKY